MRRLDQVGQDEAGRELAADLSGQRMTVLDRAVAVDPLDERAQADSRPQIQRERVVQKSDDLFLGYPRAADDVAAMVKLGKDANITPMD